MIKIYYSLILTLFLTNSCTKKDLTNDFPATVRFDVTGRLLEGKHINSIATDNKGNIYIASDKELYYKNNNGQKLYNLDFPIMDLDIAKDETVWIGTNGGGLGHLSGKGFTWYTNANAGLPRDYIKNVEIGKDGKVWFSSSAFKIGGLGNFDGIKFEFLTPENSPLNQNIIDDLEIDEDGNIYVATSGTVGKSNIYRISGKSWYCLGDEKGTFYWVWSFTIGPSGIIYLVEDFSLSSSFNTNKLYEFKENKWQKVETTDIPQINFFTPIKADKRNYCWLAGNGDHSPFLSVFNGDKWQNSPAGLFPDDYITAIEVDSNNNIWVGTWANGVFILNQ
jgi:ligand-binding sensor domain-containing protein